MNTLTMTASAPPAPTTPPDGDAGREPAAPAAERESVAGEEDPGAGVDVPARDAPGSATRVDKDHARRAPDSASTDP